MASPEIALNEALKDEGFYSNDGNDSGGETILGVARKKHPDARLWALCDKYRKQPGFPGNMMGKADIMAAAIEVYEPGFIQPLRIREIINQAAANALFNDGINKGNPPAINTVQETLGLAQTNSKIMPDETLAKLNEVNNYA